MEVKEGFQNTVVGCIPIDWEINKIGELSKTVTGNTPSSKEDGLWGNAYPWITPSDIKYNRDIWRGERSLSQKGFDRSRQLPPGTLLVTCIASIGKNAILTTGGSCNQQINAVYPSQKHSNHYLYYFLEYKSTYLSSLAGKTAVPILNKSAFDLVPIPFPNLPEQQKISEILSTVDNKLAAIDAEIEQTKTLKKGLMQTLLTQGIGHTQFKCSPLGQIPKSWAVVEMNNAITFMSDYVANGSFKSLKDNVTVFDNTEYSYYVRLYDLRRGLGHKNQKYVDKKSYEYLKKSSLHGDEILMANIGANVGECFLIPKLNKPATLAPNMISILMNNSEFNPQFVYFYLTSSFGWKEIDKVIEGSGQPKINKTRLKTLKLVMPNLSEQNQIARILTTVDNKLELLQQKKAANQQLKKGLMQQLLTGQKRVKV